MISIVLSSSTELKVILMSQKEKFDKYRIVSKKSYEAVEQVKEKEPIISLNPTSYEKNTNSGNITNDTKTYTEKIKGGYFGKRRSRF